MSELRNAEIGLEQFGAFGSPDRAPLLGDAAMVLGRDSLTVAEGRLHIDVPLSVALQHVPASNLRAALSLARCYAGILIRAVAVTPPDRFLEWAHGHGHLVDLPGQRLELLPEGRISFHLDGDAGHVLLGELEQEVAGTGVYGSNPPREDFDHLPHEVPVERLIGGDLRSFGHSEPPVAPRAQPPP